MRIVATTAVALIAVVSGFVGHQLNEHPRIQHGITQVALEVDKEGVRYLSRFGFSCGVEAWSTKTMADANARAVNLTPQATTIPKLALLPMNSGQRTTPPQVFKLSGTRLIAYKAEPDSDMHLELQSTLGSHPTMIAEIPNPTCATNSVVLNQITQARADFVSQVGQPQTYFSYLNVPITVTGIGFYDFAHGQTGAATNQIELHPVISFKRLK